MPYKSEADQYHHHFGSGEPVMSFEEWKAQLISVTAKQTGLPESEIKINDESAASWYRDGFTPYQTFRETYSNENDCE